MLMLMRKSSVSGSERTVRLRVSPLLSFSLVRVEIVASRWALAFTAQGSSTTFTSVDVHPGVL